MISLGAFAPGHQHRADEQIHVRQQFLQVRFVRIKRVRGVHRDVEKTHPFEIHFENRHVRAETVAMRAALTPAVPPPITTTLPGSTPGTPPSSTPLPPLCFARK